MAYEDRCKFCRFYERKHIGGPPNYGTCHLGGLEIPVYADSAKCQAWQARIKLEALMRIGYADPPYPGCAHKYKDHPDYAGEVDHAALIEQLEGEFDGWILHSSSVALPEIVPLCPEGVRFMAWVKPFAAFKRNVPVAYAWEPVIVKACRKPIVSGREVMRDWIAENITMKRGLTGAKPAKVCMWAFEMVGAQPQDTLVDLFPGTGAVTKAWERWCDGFRKQQLEMEATCPE